MFTPKGKFGWYELMTSDTEAAGKFYSSVVGWTTKEMPQTAALPTPSSTSATSAWPAC